ncbi:hypothetical protein [Winogradskyella sp. SM1960]|uniref:hypothetical protein n=1 Tax=Winogradskyella sp. SM1960 TaxID=2865955 RepID=UPI001CD6D3D7|nr:hypothetical protein [Winogradskyella sp. SM1960]
MKRYITLLVLILCSCNNVSNDKSIPHSEMDDLENNAISTLDIEKPNFTELHIIEEKLQDTYDLIYLSEKNSDFETTKLSNSIIIQNLDSLDHQGSPFITDLHQIGNTETVNDSISHIRFSYILKQGNSEQLDTLKAIIKKQNITIEGHTKTALKIDFTNRND